MSTIQPTGVPSGINRDHPLNKGLIRDGRYFDHALSQHDVESMYEDLTKGMPRDERGIVRFEDGDHEVKRGLVGWWKPKQ